MFPGNRICLCHADKNDKKILFAIGFRDYLQQTTLYIAYLYEDGKNYSFSKKVIYF